jgi:hypothetical protein
MEAIPNPEPLDVLLDASPMKEILNICKETVGCHCANGPYIK